MSHIVLSALAALIAIASLAAAEQQDPLARFEWLLRQRRPPRSWSWPSLVGPSLPAAPSPKRSPPVRAPPPKAPPPKAPAPKAPASKAPPPKAPPPKAPPPKAPPPKAPPPSGDVSVDVSGGNCPDARSILDLSNVYRARHQAPPLAWSASLAASSTSYADKLATTCQLIHSTDRSYGENLLSQMQYPHPDTTCTKAAQGWYSEVESYDFKTAQPFTDNWPKGIGHFTALVWVGTTSMGCGMSLKDYRVDIGNGRTVVGGCKVIVCRYQPPGNFATNAEFMRNVLRNTSATDP